MIVSYRPESGAERVWDFDPNKVRVAKAEMIERRADDAYFSWVNDVRVGRAKARKVLLWHLLTVDHPAFRWEDTPDFAMDELQVEFTKPELADLMEQIKAARGVAQDKKDQILEGLAGQMEDAPDPKSVAVPSLTSDPSGGVS